MLVNKSLKMLKTTKHIRTLIAGDSNGYSECYTSSTKLANCLTPFIPVLQAQVPVGCL